MFFPFQTQRYFFPIDLHVKLPNFRRDLIPITHLNPDLIQIWIPDPQNWLCEDVDQACSKDYMQIPLLWIQIRIQSYDDKKMQNFTAGKNYIF
jgi:hypothetical protein